MQPIFIAALSLAASSCSPGDKWGVLNGTRENGIPGCVVESAETGLDIDDVSALVGDSLASVLATSPTSLAADFVFSDGISVAPFAANIHLQTMDAAAPVEAYRYDEAASGGEDCLLGATFTFQATVAIEVEDRIIAASNGVWVTMYGSGQMANLEMDATVADADLVAALQAEGVDTDSFRLLWTRTGLALGLPARSSSP